MRRQREPCGSLWRVGAQEIPSESSTFPASSRAGVTCDAPIEAALRGTMRDMAEVPAPRGRRGAQYQMEVRLRENQAVKLRAQGLTLDEIAEALDFGAAQSAKHAIDRALRRNVEGDTHLLRRIESERLQSYMRALLAELEREHVVVNQGRVVLDPRTHEPIRDTGAVVMIYRELRALSREYSLLHGLHAPLRAIVQEITLDMVQGEMARINSMAEELEREMGHEGVPVGTAPEDRDFD